LFVEKIAAGNGRRIRQPFISTL